MIDQGAPRVIPDSISSVLDRLFDPLTLITGAMTPADQANNEPSPCHDLLTFLDQPARVLLTPTFGFWKRSIASSVRRYRQERSWLGRFPSSPSAG